MCWAHSCALRGSTPPSPLSRGAIKPPPAPLTRGELQHKAFALNDTSIICIHTEWLGTLMCPSLEEPRDCTHANWGGGASQRTASLATANRIQRTDAIHRTRTPLNPLVQGGAISCVLGARYVLRARARYVFRARARPTTSLESRS
jgi:hypothetical protein